MNMSDDIVRWLFTVHITIYAVSYIGIVVGKVFLLALRLLALSEEIPVMYQDQTPSGRCKKAIQVNSAHTRKRIRSTDACEH